MVYLYAGLGVVMLTGIMAIFEMGLSLTGQSMLPTPPDEYSENAEMKVADKRILEILTDRDVFDGEIAGVSLCTELLEGNSVEACAVSHRTPNSSFAHLYGGLSNLIASSAT